MNSMISILSDILEALFKAKETEDTEFEDAQKWLTDIIENINREKSERCDICRSNIKLELHHIRGRKHGNEVTTVCYECHRTLTSNQRLWDRARSDSDSDNGDTFLKRGLIDICNLKFNKTGIEIYKRFAEKLTEGFSYE